MIPAPHQFDGQRLRARLEAVLAAVEAERGAGRLWALERRTRRYRLMAAVADAILEAGRGLPTLELIRRALPELDPRAAKAHVSDFYHRAWIDRGDGGYVLGEDRTWQGTLQRLRDEASALATLRDSLPAPAPGHDSAALVHELGPVVMPTGDREQLVLVRDVAAAMGVARRDLLRKAYANRFPPILRVTSTHLLMKRGDLEDWAAGTWRPASGLLSAEDCLTQAARDGTRVNPRARKRVR